MILDGQLTDAVKEVDNSLLGGNHNAHEVHLGAKLYLEELVAVIGQTFYHGAMHIVYLKSLMTAFIGGQGMDKALVHIPINEGIHDLVSGKNADHLSCFNGAHHLLALLFKGPYADIVFMAGFGLVRLGGGLLFLLLGGGNGGALLSFGHTNRRTVIQYTHIIIY